MVAFVLAGPTRRLAAAVRLARRRAIDSAFAGAVCVVFRAAHLRVAAVVVLLRLRRRASVWAEQPIGRPLVAKLAAEQCARRRAWAACMFGGLFWMIWHTGDYWWLIAAGGVLSGQRGAGPARAGGVPAAVLQDRADRRADLLGADATAGRRDGPGDRGRLPHGPRAPTRRRPTRCWPGWAARGAC